METLEQLEKEASAGALTVDMFGERVAKLFKVRKHEVALLALRHSMLRFLYPRELKNIGVIPLTSTAQVAKTAQSKRFEMFNNFVRVQHKSVFEAVKVGEGDSQTIQKLISGPVLSSHGEVLGVIQISHKGPDVCSSGNDFTSDDLKLLDETTRLFGRVMNQLLATTAAQENPGRSA